MDIRVKLLADDKWSAEYDKTGFLSVEDNTQFSYLGYHQKPFGLSHRYYLPD